MKTKLDPTTIDVSRPVEKWSDDEIQCKVDEHWKIAFSTDGKGLTEEIKDLDRRLKAEYWRREKLGLHVEIDCMICTDDKVSYYDIMKEFCSDMNKIQKNICNKHVDSFNEKRLEFLK
jgi:hypothetical protein